MWILRFCDWAKHLSHTLHWYCFSLECVRMWHCWFHFLSKHLSHTLHWCCFFPLVCCRPLLDFERLEIWSWDVLPGMFTSAWSIVMLLLSPGLAEHWGSDAHLPSLELSEYKHIVFMKIYSKLFNALFSRIQNVNYLKQDSLYTANKFNYHNLHNRKHFWVELMLFSNAGFSHGIWCHVWHHLKDSNHQIRQRYSSTTIDSQHGSCRDHFNLPHLFAWVYVGLSTHTHARTGMGRFLYYSRNVRYIL